MYKNSELLFLLLMSSIGTVNSQVSSNKFDGIWEFIPMKESRDTSFQSYQIFKKNKIINIFYWTKTKSTSIYGSPFSYFGFWDTYLENPQPKKLIDLKSTGKYVFFYDDLVKIDSRNKIGYDSLGNLYTPTRKCQWILNDELPKYLPPTTLTLYFNMNPDMYKKVNLIPNYVLISLRSNKEYYKMYLDFMEFKETKITKSKAFIYKSTDTISHMYLLAGDSVELIEEKGDWLKIRYYGKSTIEGWIKKSDVE